MMRRSTLPIWFVTACLVSGEVSGGDWPQILGPRRNGVAEGERLHDAWPDTGPKTAWTHRLGSGYAGPAVVGNRVLVFHRVGGSERLEALDAKSGKELWKVDFPARYPGGVNEDRGPRCVPLVHKNRVYVFGAAGELHCVALENGKKFWSRSAYVELNGRLGYFGAGSTPIVADEKLLVNVGGRRRAGLAAFALETGKTAWSATSEGASYSSPTSAQLGGQTHVIFVTRLNTISVNPRDGKTRFEFSFGRTGPTVNAATPLVFDGHVFVSAAYGVGAQLAQITPTGARQVWANDESMSSQYSTCVYHDGHLYGTHGREDFDNGELRCIEAKTGKVMWSEKGFGVASVILVEGKLLLLNHRGKLTQVNATPVGYQPQASVRVTDGITRALPALSNGRYFFRSNRGEQGTLKCLAVGRTK